MMKKTEFITLLGFILSTVLLKSDSTRIKSDKLVIDTDAGSDDAMALLLTLSVSANNDTNFDIVAITCTYGNTNLTNVEKNVLKTLTIANESKIPVYSGAFKPLTENHTSDNFFGNDGFGDFKFNREIIGNIDRSKHASAALIDLANKYPGELNILVLGPATNVALAISLDPKFVYKVKRFYVIGGSVNGIGNRSPGVKFNFGADPESNFILYNSTRREVSLLLPWETILSTNISSSWRKNVLGRVGSKFITFLNKAESKILDAPNWLPSDSLIAAAMLCPKLIKKSMVTNITPITDGKARGGALVDYTKLTHKPNNVEIIQDIDVEEFQKILLKYLS
ncbi:probable uridine nucleosidase 1 isoform X1 [Myzus persicae]|uniref:probable uridine nucleosidase 1 isoform X1 n=1 Tax=Myzus persicae TaxID=13164 RepID=UPI000B9329FB|nr:probable uridine nucleosidase 1 isoform X1 [Myzus persicae]XP_022171774.1 probable uridine nucleosidase 1 isoform X1 [Myzus persicae]XP_022171775.1 probable uridine nucleosidase 1 isoform X1 [Myzus persicae]XP_022171776.1 probable uridine nucleosidase 1 isoform X1 [Myzus persicae]